MSQLKTRGKGIGYLTNVWMGEPQQVKNQQNDIKKVKTNQFDYIKTKYLQVKQCHQQNQKAEWVSYSQIHDV